MRLGALHPDSAIIALSSLHCTADLPPSIVPVVKLELPALELARLDGSIGESYGVGMTCPLTEENPTPLLGQIIYDQHLVVNLRKLSEFEVEKRQALKKEIEHTNSPKSGGHKGLKESFS